MFPLRNDREARVMKSARTSRILALAGGLWLAASAAAEGAGVEPAGQATAEPALAVLKSYCYRCHGQDGRNEGGLNVVTDLRKLVESKRVVPGQPDQSKLLRRVVTGDMPPELDFEDQSENPPALPKPGAKEIAALRAWIKAGAPDIVAPPRERRFLSDLDMLKFMLDDLKKTPARSRRFIRYFTLTHLENAGYNDDQLQTYRHGLSKLVNSLSWSRRIKVPTPIDPARTILRIDLRDYLWDEGTWRSVLDRYPYGLHHEGTTAGPIYELTASPLPYVRADWFVFAASRPPLYHEVLRLPRAIEELERKLDVDAAANIRQDRAVRAGFNASGVSRNNRVIERHESTNGGYWKSYDFGGNADRKNIFANPLGPGDGDAEFAHDGGEIIFALPNGLNGYMLTDGNGARIDKGPTEIVRDNKQSDGAVVNGISCMSCHNRGLIEKADQVRDVVTRSKSFDKEVVETVKVLYPPREKFEELLHGDLDRFARAVKETGASLSKTEPVFALATQFEDELNQALAAAEAGMKPREFADALAHTPQLGQALGPLSVGGTVKRDVFVDCFPMIARARHLTLLETAPAEPQTQPQSRATVARNTLPPAQRGLPPKQGQSQQGRMSQSRSQQSVSIQRRSQVTIQSRSQFGSQQGVQSRSQQSQSRSQSQLTIQSRAQRGGRPPSPPRQFGGMPNANPAAPPTVAVRTAGSGKEKAYPPDSLSLLPASFFGPNRDRFAEAAPAGALFVGVRVSYVLFFGGPKISSVQPLYRSGSSATLIEGQRYGTVNGPETTALAKPGYAVGALRTHTGLSVDGFELVFMKVKKDQLDTTDNYLSPWLGDPQGGSPRDVLNQGGNLVVGLQGRAGKKVDALGLVIHK
jgi:hypothetical protein